MPKNVVLLEFSNIKVSDQNQMKNLQKLFKHSVNSKLIA